MPTVVVCPMPAFVSWNAASYVRVPERETRPTWPGLLTLPGLMPTYDCPEVRRPGQFGPRKRVFFPRM